MKRAIKPYRVVRVGTAIIIKADTSQGEARLRRIFEQMMREQEEDDGIPIDETPLPDEETP